MIRAGQGFKDSFTGAKLKNPRLILLSVLFLCCLSACAGYKAPMAMAPLPPVTSRTPIPPTATPMPSLNATSAIAPSDALTVAPTNTVTHKPTLIPKPAITVTRTTQPTISATEAEGLLYSLMANNGSCRLPCLWGLTPGVTDTQSRKDYFDCFGRVSGANFSTGRGDDETRHTGSLSFFPVLDHIEFLVSLIYYDSEGFVEQLDLETLLSRDDRVVFDDADYNDLVRYYQVPQVLSMYGKPDHILILPIPHDPFARADYDEFTLVMIYTQAGFLVEYISDYEMIDGNYHSCPTQGFLRVRTWSPQSDDQWLKVASRNKHDSGLRANTIEYFEPLEEKTTLSEDDFYEAFKAPNEVVCIDTPVNLWPQLP